jgi:hypothetical protein
MARGQPALWDISPPLTYAETKRRLRTSLQLFEARRARACI